VTTAFDPVKRSPVHRQHAGLGAHFAREAGWEIPAGYGSIEDERRALTEGVALADVTARGKVDLRGDVEPVLRRLETRGHLARISARWALALTEPAELEGCLSEAEAAAASGEAMATDATSLYAGFALSGPAAANVLSRLTPFDAARLPQGACAATRVAEVPAILVRPALGVAPFEMCVGSEYARYVWESLLEAGADLGLCPAGWEALRAEGWW
jgi:heterotetrameric sarcosine oxidase gamma subunit